MRAYTILKLSKLAIHTIKAPSMVPDIQCECLLTQIELLRAIEDISNIAQDLQMYLLKGGWKLDPTAQLS